MLSEIASLITQKTVEFEATRAQRENKDRRGYVSSDSDDSDGGKKKRRSKKKGRASSIVK